jgi:hypothetical protein
MGSLCQELINEGNRIEIRKSAAIAFKNALTAKVYTTFEIALTSLSTHTLLHEIESKCPRAIRQ